MREMIRAAAALLGWRQIVMASWSDVVAHLAAHHPCEKRRDDWIAVRVCGGGDGLVHVYRFPRRERWQLLLLAEVCPSSWTVPGEALDRNLRLGCGSLVLLGDTLALRCILPLAGLELTDVDDAVSSLHADAVGLRCLWMRRPTATADVFATFVD